MGRKLGLGCKRGYTNDGYTLFAPQAGTNVFLIDMRGDVSPLKTKLEEAKEEYRTLKLGACGYLKVRADQILCSSPL